jgi:hypothetical protein
MAQTATWDATIPLKIGQTETTINLQLVGLPEIDGCYVYALIPSGCEGWGCEVCGAVFPASERSPLYYLEGERFRRLCAIHANGTPIGLGLLRIRIEENETEPVVNDRATVHRLAAELHEKGLSYGQVSAELSRRGYEKVSARTIQKHLSGGCACFKES